MWKEPATILRLQFPGQDREVNEPNQQPPQLMFAWVVPKDTDVQPLT